MSSRRSGGPVVLCVQTEGGRRACDDEAWSVWYWPVDVTSWLVGDITLAGLRCTSILEPGYSLSMGSFLSSSPVLSSSCLLPFCLLLFPISYPLLHSHLHLSSAFLFSPLPILFCPPPSPHPFLFCPSSVLLSHSLPLPSIHPHGSNSLSGLSHSLQASRQSLQRLEQKTNSFKQHYIGLAWSMSHTDRWKHWPLRHCLYMDMMKHEQGSLSVPKPTALHLNIVTAPPGM